jgi:DNA-binding GntR family transcriptional regulator
MYQKLLLSEKIADNIMTGIKNGFYQVGDQMPNELELSAELGVSRATLREALKILISKNVLEVKRGIGTFVSETPGFSVEAIGMHFLNLTTQKNEIQKLVNLLYEEEIHAFQHLSFESQQNIRQKLKVKEQSVIDIVHALFDAMEEIATLRQSTFKHRIMMIVHDAFIISMQLETIEFDGSILNSYAEFCDNLGKDNASVYFGDFMMRLRQLHKEV